MPKESVYCCADRHYRVGVHWTRDGEHVEISTKTDTALAVHTLVDHMPESQVPDSRYEGQIAWSGLHCQLNRAAVNQLIRVLRRARDQAFGRDE